VASSLQVLDLGLVDYREAWALQLRLVDERAADARPDTLVVCQHPHVFTLGRRAGAHRNVLDAGDVPVVEVERGGDVTYHGPGQLVGYPILKLGAEERDLQRFLRHLEEALIRALKGSVGLEAGRREGATGVWAAGRKIASLGVAVRNWVTFHGFALNVATDLSYFGRIVPCGLPAEVMSSVTRLLGREVGVRDVQAAVVAAVAEVFGRHLDDGRAP
jgi:lipoyl(octanoyl) transferase